MYTSIRLPAILLLALATASPVPEGLPDGTAIVEIQSATSYSSLIMANPSSPPTASETYLTPTNINLPTPSATFELGGGGDLPSLPAVPSQLGASESGGVKLVGQDSSGSNSTLEDDEAVLRDDTKKQGQTQANSAACLAGLDTAVWTGGLIVTGFAILGLY